MAERRTQSRTHHGREQVVDALIEAATRLFSDRGVSAVSVRDIARHAGVNHGLVHRHFGSKMGLLRAVFRRLLQELHTAAEESPEGSGLFPDLFDASRQQRDLLRIRMYALLEGYPMREIQGEFHIAHRLREAFRRAEGEGRMNPELSPELATASLLAASMGWMMFEPFVIEAAGLDPARTDQLAREFNGLIKNMTEKILLSGDATPAPDSASENIQSAAPGNKARG